MIARITVSAAVLLAAVSVSPAPAAATEQSYYGINGQFLQVPVPFVDVAERDRHLATIAATGIDVVRVQAYWHEIEPVAPTGGSHSYRWSALDEIVGALAREGLTLLPVLGYSARWANPTGALGSPPAPHAVPDFAAFGRAVVERYGAGGTFWRANSELSPQPVAAVQVWNEQSHPTWWRPAPDPAAYADLYRATRTAVHAVEPRIEVITGGLPGAHAVGFVRAMYEARPQLRGRVDAVGLHPYAADLAGVVAYVASLRRTLDDLGERRVPISITEVGWPTSGAGSGDFLASGLERSLRLSALALALPRSNCGVDRLIPHTWTTPEENPADPQHWFGLVDPDAENLFGVLAYAGAVRLIEGRGGPGSSTEVLPLCGRASAAGG